MSSGSIRQTILMFDTAVYRLTAIKKAVYKFSGRCLINIQLVGERQVRLTVECQDAAINVEDLKREIQCEVTDQELREVILDETAGVRNLLLAEAFSATSLIEPEGTDADYLLDPLQISDPDA